MMVRCFLPWRGGAWTGLCSGMKPLLVMLLAMPPICAAAAGVIAHVPGYWQPFGYGAAMWVLGTMVERWRWVDEFTRRRMADRPINAQPLV